MKLKIGDCVKLNDSYFIINNSRNQVKSDNHFIIKGIFKYNGIEMIQIYHNDKNIRDLFKLTIDDYINIYRGFLIKDSQYQRDIKLNILLNEGR